MRVHEGSYERESYKILNITFAILPFLSEENIFKLNDQPEKYFGIYYT